METFDAGVGGSLSPRLRELLKLRVSHINGCAFTVRMASETLGRMGARVDLISALARPVSLVKLELLDPPEVAALRFAEVLTDAPRGIEPAARDAAAEHFSPEQLGAIVEVVAVTNAWNRVTRGTE